MTVTIASFVDDVLEDVAGCNKPAATKAIRRAAIEFCKETECWQYNHADITLTIDDSDVPLSLPSDSRLRRITNMLNIDGKTVIEKDDRWLDDNIVDWRTTTGAGSANIYFSQESQTITIVAVPVATITPGLTGVKMVLVPTQESTTLDDILNDDFRNEILDGAKYFLMRQKGKPWSDKESASDYKSSFYGGMRDARYLLNKGFSGGVLNVAGHDYENSSRAQNWFRDDDS